MLNYSDSTKAIHRFVICFQKLISHLLTLELSSPQLLLAQYALPFCTKTWFASKLLRAVTASAPFFTKFVTQFLRVIHTLMVAKTCITQYLNSKSFLIFRAKRVHPVLRRADDKLTETGQENPRHLSQAHSLL